MSQGLVLILSVAVTFVIIVIEFVIATWPTRKKK